MHLIRHRWRWFVLFSSFRFGLFFCLYFFVFFEFFLSFLCAIDVIFYVFDENVVVQFDENVFNMLCLLRYQVYFVILFYNMWKTSEILLYLFPTSYVLFLLSMFSGSDLF